MTYFVGLQSADKTKTTPKAKLQSAPTFTGNGSHSYVCLFLVITIKTCTYQLCKRQLADTSILIGRYWLSADHWCISNPYCSYCIAASDLPLWRWLWNSRCYVWLTGNLQYTECPAERGSGIPGRLCQVPAASCAVYRDCCHVSFCFVCVLCTWNILICTVTLCRRN